jgi:hemoglobin-like flavoprotein
MGNQPHQGYDQSYTQHKQFKLAEAQKNQQFRDRNANNMNTTNNINLYTPPFGQSSFSMQQAPFYPDTHSKGMANKAMVPDNNVTTGLDISDLSPHQIQLLQHQQYIAKQQQKHTAEILGIFTGEPMEICWVFWKDNVDILPRNKQKELALLLYSHMFQKIPSARRLFVKGEIDKQALKFLDMFGFLIRQLKDPDQESLLNTLQGLGRRHGSWGVRMEYFQPMMLSLHSALSDHFQHTYTVRVKFCMEQLFSSAANVMTGQDLNSIFSTRYANIRSLAFLTSLEDCLSDEIGLEYLERFLTQSFCGELIEFHHMYKKYRGALSDKERYLISVRIVHNFLMPNGDNELNIKDMSMRDQILKRLQKKEKKFNKTKSGSEQIPMPVDMFDPIFEWVMNEIRENTWPKFKTTITSIAVVQSR